MALATAWLEHLFAKLAARYGDLWFRKWEGVPLQLVRADWADVLDGLSEQALLYGLKNLPPEFPPTATAFRALCNTRPDPPPLQLEPPTTDAQKVAQAVRDLELTRAKDPDTLLQRWLRLKARIDSGDRTVTITQRELCLEALRKLGHHDSATEGAF